MKVKYFFICFFAMLAFMSHGFCDNERTQQDLVKIKQELARQKQEKEKLDNQDKEIKQVLSENESRLIKIAGNIKESEKKINGLNTQLEFLDKQQMVYSFEMKEMQKEMSEILAILQMFALTPQAVLFETDGDVSAQINSAISLENSVMITDEKFKQYIGLIDKIEKNQKEISTAKISLDRNKDEMAKKQQNMKSVISEQNKKLEKVVEEKKNVESQINKLAKESKDLEDFLKKALTKKPATERYEKYTGSAPRLSPAPIPVEGTVVLSFGELNENKIKSDGWKIKTGTSAVATSSHNGVVIFADYFKGYNKLVIIEHNQNFHTIIANLGAIYVREGQSVKVGTPVGEVGQSRIMYLEIRYKNKPLNPSAYFKN